MSNWKVGKHAKDPFAIMSMSDGAQWSANLRLVSDTVTWSEASTMLMSAPACGIGQRR